ncbi:AMP-binding protein [Phytohabitans sp. ZYX-F-186]|uniref:AMP-binding protein n=1 Tax=Phytohabitans maris TaxID=3071409 RepID=A0ABU0ZKD8_9ACTN|nr:AMP-binding protein [Phytohabitans sp. ZYX-F-186]MDQ7906725.1 AMP-binding protein [Phytohabitans sp. ZYX-F-186]
MHEPAAVDEPARNLADYVRRAARAGADRPALLWRDGVVTWGQLDARVDAAARGLGGLAADTAGHPARVAVALGNTPDFAVAFFGALRAGLAAVPVNPEYTARELRHVLADSAATALVCTERVRDTVDGIRGELPALSAVHVDLLDLDGPPPAGETGGEDLAVLLYTSGTEGSPKGAMLSHRALIANHVQVARVPSVLGPDDVLLLAVPLFHAYGLNSGLGAVAFHAACGVLVERFDPAATLETIARHSVTAVVGVPSMYVGWAARPELDGAFGSVRLAVCGAAPLEPATAARVGAATGRQVFVGYGLTETAPVLTSTLLSSAPKMGSIGQPLPGVELRLVAADGGDIWRDGTVDPDAEDELLVELESPGTDPGEIVVRGDNLFSGYWPDGHDGPDPAGWWATGDVAYADADGDLFLVDRLGELILVSGFNVYPHEVELVIEACPGVVEAAVLGAPHPQTGQTVRAYVVREPGSELTVAELQRHCERNLARFKCPTAIEFVPSLPHSPTGKVRKTLLRSEAVQ